MNPQESLNFFATQLAGSARGLEVAKSSRNLQLAALNFRQMFKEHLMCGLIKWRQQENPTSYFDDAIRLITEAATTLPAWASSFNIGEGLPLGRASLLASLTGAPFDLGQLENSTLPVDVRLDCLLANASPSAKAMDLANALIGELRGGKRTALAAETYENYFHILASESNFARIEELLKKGEALFAKRARDAFFSGGDQTEGGGPDNALVVDYRLALALKKVRYGSDSMHAWVW